MNTSFKIICTLLLFLLSSSTMYAQQSKSRSIVIVNSKTHKQRSVNEGKKIKVRSDQLESLYEKGKFSLPSETEIEINNSVIHAQSVEAIWLPNKGAQGVGTAIMIGGGIIFIAGVTADRDQTFNLGGVAAAFGGGIILAGYFVSDIRKGYNLQDNWSLQIE